MCTGPPPSITQVSTPVSDMHIASLSKGYDLEGASSKLMILDSGVACAPPLGNIEDEDVEDRVMAMDPPAAGRGVEEGGSRGRSGCVSVRISSTSSSSSSSMLGQADWSSTRFKRSLRALRASCLQRGGKDCYGTSLLILQGGRINPSLVIFFCSISERTADCHPHRLNTIDTAHLDEYRTFL